MNAVGKKYDQRPVEWMRKLGWISDRGEIRQHVNELIERRISAKLQQDGNERRPGPEPNILSLQECKN